MAAKRHRARGLRSLRTSLALGLVGVLAGVLFATNAGLFSEATDRRPQDLRDLVRDENLRMQELTEEVDGLRSEVDGLIHASATGDEDHDEAPAEIGIAAGRTAVQGPGVRVELWDSPYSEPPEGYTVDSLVVHQQDVDGVLNGLRAGGAEAIAVQGHRVTSTTSIRCVGNVLLVDGRIYSPPFVIEAIGNPQELTDAVNADTAVQDYLSFVNQIQLGWSMQTHDEMSIAGFEGNLSLGFARVPGHEPYVPDDDSTTPPFSERDYE